MISYCLKKPNAAFLASQCGKTRTNLDLLSHSPFPALSTSYMYLLRILIYALASL